MTAGAELNVAIGLARLGLHSAYVSSVGADSFGRHLLAALDREGVDRSRVGVDPLHATGFMLKSLQRRWQRSADRIFPPRFGREPARPGRSVRRLAGRRAPSAPDRHLRRGIADDA